MFSEKVRGKFRLYIDRGVAVRFFLAAENPCAAIVFKKDSDFRKNSAKKLNSFSLGFVFKVRSDFMESFYEQGDFDEPFARAHRWLSGAGFATG
ncbi:MAG TPA: hypothetical protein EYN91_21965 [Candidatus Melainabacteria bacterium]|nr:hypothetical protein [Candidatus Melainabacteria bacterium]HIN66884.1 hypothetical protein [Candidatus Obscuribacterales bacterium]